ncbi:uncharacterized protein LOC116416070 [Nasonia vitripennis]|uniref:Uncharacterized protein n=1 Tax=Nasonia vitripennis TaxID=7425 RepID=A0A7M7Q133_NASVI|nr:uncharacterized protein LOC116416070 [Nasonia vitripennis]
MYQIMKEDIHKFDTSDYDENNQFEIPRVNKKVPGLMKDECCGKIMTEFVGLRSKMYSILIDGAETVKKAKGIKSNVVKKSITFEDYRKCLQDLVIIKREQCNIRSKLYIVHTEKQEKIALSPHYDKRYLLPHSTDTLPWGHYRIMEEQMAQAAMHVEGEAEERGYNAANGNEAEEKREGESGRGDEGEQIRIEYDVPEEFMHEWDPSLDKIRLESEERRDILLEAMERAGILVGNGLYERTDNNEEHIREIEANNEPSTKRPRLT